jgi:hypothetical protein
MKGIFLIAIFSVLLISSCQTSTVQNNQANRTENKEIASTYKGNFNAEFKSEPAEIKAGEKAKLIFTVKNNKGETIKDLQIVHEKPMHLLIVSDDLDEFYHEHPEAQADGTYQVNFTFQGGGRYRLYTDFTPLNSDHQVVQNFPLQVSGNERTTKELKPNSNFEKTVENLRVVMKPDGDLVSNKELMLSFQVFDAAANKPVTDLENYLGAKSHFVVISQDLQEFVHAHPMSTDNVKSGEHKHAAMTDHKTDGKLASADAASIVSAHVTFPKPGIYRVWAQFKRGGKVTTVPFTFEVKKGEAEKRLETVEIPKGAFKVVVSRDGFTPQEISFKKGQPLKLAFYRADEENCGGEVVFKDLNIKKSLPVGKVVPVDVPTDKEGEISFACGMNMYKGKIIVQ